MARPGSEASDQSPAIHPVSGKCSARDVSGSVLSTIAASRPRSRRMQMVTKKIVAST